MLFKIFYCDDAATARHVFNEYQNAGYATDIYDRSDCATFDIIRDTSYFVENRLVIKGSNGRSKFSERLSYWRNYIIVFEDNTVVNLIRNFNGSEDSVRNNDMLTKFINLVHEKLNQTNTVIIQDDDEDFVI